MTNRGEAAKAAVIRQFGEHAANFVMSQEHAKGGDLALLLEWLKPQPEWVVLDVATGGGHVARTLSPRVAQVVAADLTPAMLEAARTHLTEAGCRNVLFVSADAEALPFLAGSFDAVTCRIAPHHFPNPPAFVTEVARVLKPGGRFVLIDNVAPADPALGAFLNEVEELRDESHVRCLPVAEWETLLADAGLELLLSRSGRKTHNLGTWLARVDTPPDRAGAVEAMLLGASDPAQAHFTIEARQGRVQSFTVDDWMVLAGKPGSLA